MNPGEKQYESVLFVKMNEGKVESVVDESRMVYYKKDGKVIKTVSDGTVEVNEHGLAVLSYRRVPLVRKDGSTLYMTRKVKEKPEVVEDALNDMLWTYRLAPPRFP
jgi:arginyl-tRNA synthetase